ncbi:HGGxSTG domain-containing protein [Methylobacterium sp. Leaf87]|uniref:HGGxSTG domain-containing protein n=1 Tax=Methylobacterium sp. Leaf87 TaxID=1736243 RepID=UPI000A72A79A|nr:HGGxSTG domain-containing protein [Methylobacterium sp. Leaf87]
MRRHTCSHPGWNKSPEWAAIARAAILKFHAGRHLLPKCGAKRKSTGTLCQNLPSPGRTRCRLHGGATPKGSGPTGWHTPAFPGGMPTGKLRSDAFKQRRRWKAIARVEDMTPEERARYEAWKASHAPGSPAKRQRRRQDRDAAQWLQELMSAPDEPPPAPRRIRKPKPLTAERAIRERIGVFA